VLTQERDVLTQERDVLTQERDAILESRSWRFTRILRYLLYKLRRIAFKYSRNKIKSKAEEKH
jgi:predicted Zn-dependent peptidase